MHWERLLRSGHAVSFANAGSCWLEFRHKGSGTPLANGIRTLQYKADVQDRYHCNRESDLIVVMTWTSSWTVVWTVLVDRARQR